MLFVFFFFIFIHFLHFILIYYAFFSNDIFLCNKRKGRKWGLCGHKRTRFSFWFIVKLFVSKFVFLVNVQTQMENPKVTDITFEMILNRRYHESNGESPGLI